MRECRIMSELKWKYRRFTCEEDQLQALLDEYGAAGWRLHTCKPIVSVGALGTGLIKAFVVFEMVEQTETFEEIPDDEPEGLAMRG